LDCPLEELERRESERDARRQGFAVSSSTTFTRTKIYDLKLDTSVLSAEECVGRILEFYNFDKPRAFAEMRVKIKTRRTSKSTTARGGGFIFAP
jgi:hypothetical protein